MPLLLSLTAAVLVASASAKPTTEKPRCDPVGDWYMSNSGVPQRECVRAAEPTAQPERSWESGPSSLVIHVVNRQDDDLRIYQVDNVGSPHAIYGTMGESIVTAGASTTWAFPKGWAGTIQMGLRSNPVSSFMSLAEGSYHMQTGVAPWHVIDWDVSYAAGFTVPIVCSCEETGQILTGCNTDLWRTGTCKSLIMGACPNPLQGSHLWNVEPDSFFKPCQTAAYTYPNDHAANSNGHCQWGAITCCVGSNCEPHPTQQQLWSWRDEGYVRDV